MVLGLCGQEVSKAYMGGQFRPMTVVSGGGIGAALTTALAPVAAEIAGDMAKKALGLGLKPHGTGLTPHGGAAMEGEIPNPSGAGICGSTLKGEIPSPSGAGVCGRGRKTPIADFFKKVGKDVDRSVKKATKDVDRSFKRAGQDITRGLSQVPEFLTSAPVRQVVRTTRGVATPILRDQLVPLAIDKGVDALGLVPTVGPALQVAGQFAKEPAKKGAKQLIDLGSREAEKAGYGAQFQGYNYAPAHLQQMGSKNVELDKHSIDILDSIVGKRREKRGGGMRML